MLTVEKVIKEKDGWCDFWNNSESRHLFNHPVWFEICTKVFKYKDLSIIKNCDNNKINMILPVSIKNKKLISIGEKYLDKSNILVDKEADGLNEFLIKNGYTLYLEEVDEKLINFFPFKRIIYESSLNPQTDLNVEMKVKPKELRYLNNIYKKNPMIKFHTIYGKECFDYIDVMFEIEKQSNKPQKKKALFNNVIAQELFKQIAKTEFAILTIMYYDNIPVAHMFGLNNFNGIYSAYHMAYKSQYKNLQPGKLVILNLFDILKLNGFKIFDFSRGDSALKRHFSTSVVKNYNIILNPKTLDYLKFNITKIIQKPKPFFKKIIKRGK